MSKNDHEGVDLGISTLARLHSCELFQSLEERELRQLIQFCKRITFSPGDVIIQEGSRATCIYILVQGVVTSCLLSAVGKFPLNFIKAPGAFGFASLTDQPIHPISYVAQSVVEALYISRADLLYFCESNLARGFYLFRQLANHSEKNVKFVVQQLKDLLAEFSYTVASQSYVR